VQALSPITVDTYVDRVHCKPWGLDGGLEGEGNSVGLRQQGRWREDIANGKAISVRLRPGDAFRISSGGGGGFGDPLERPATRVAEDVAEGYVTKRAAETLYGVALDTHGNVDEAETSQHRSSLMKSGLKSSSP
jgi:N-methylhydantoinase B